jgi:hypothetical protein
LLDDPWALAFGKTPEEVKAEASPPLQGKAEGKPRHDSSTTNLIRNYRKLKEM